MRAAEHGPVHIYGSGTPEVDTIRGEWYPSNYAKNAPMTVDFTHTPFGRATGITGRRVIEIIGFRAANSGQWRRFDGRQFVDFTVVSEDGTKRRAIVTKEQFARNVIGIVPTDRRRREIESSERAHSEARMAAVRTRYPVGTTYDIEDFPIGGMTMRVTVESITSRGGIPHIGYSFSEAGAGPYREARTSGRDMKPIDAFERFLAS